MKNIKKSILFSILLFVSLMFISNFCNAATTKTVETEDDLISAISEATDGDIIKLSTNIILKKPLEISDKGNITIDGNGNSISREATNWTPNDNNGSLITAGAKTKLELRNLTLTNSQKYGVQAYDGGHVILNGVTISNCGYGAVLANAGTVEVKDLTLQKNGTPNNNGIEIAKGDKTSDANVPEIIMNGTLSSTEKNNVVYVAENNPNLKSFEVKNTDDTIYKILVNDNKVVITDDENKIIYTSNDIKDVKIEGETYSEKTPAKKEDKKDKTPKTGIENNVVLAIFVMTASAASIVILKRKEICD